MTTHKRPHELLATAILSISLSACANLPSSGPTGSQIYSASKPAENTMGFEIVELQDMQAIPFGADRGSETFRPLVPGREQPSNLVGANDILDVAIYEAGISLFSGSAAGLAASAGLDSGAKAERMPGLRVDDDGYISLPYAGRIKAAGLTTTELQQVIEKALVGRSQSPQVVVSLQQSVTNSILLYGEVVRAGRLVLPTNHETLLDVIALAGGYRSDAADLLVRLERRGEIIEGRLDALQRSPAGEMRVFPGDRISLLREQQSFSVMGAAGRAARIPFNKSSLSLAEALSLSGGSDDARGDPEAVFVFRFAKEGEGEEKPVVYHLNMMKPQAYFLSQKFAMRDQDVLYIGNAKANQPSKMVHIISQLFAPIVTVRNITR